MKERQGKFLLAFIFLTIGLGNALFQQEAMSISKGWSIIVYVLIFLGTWLLLSTLFPINKTDNDGSR